MDRDGEATRREEGEAGEPASPVGAGGDVEDAVAQAAEGALTQWTPPDEESASGEEEGEGAS